MKTLGEEITDWKEYISDYVSSQSELFKLRLVDKLTTLFSSIINKIVVITFLLLIMFFTSVALAIYIGEVLESASLGFLCVSGIYLFMMCAFLIFKQSLVERNVIKALLDFVFEKPDSHDQSN